MPETPKLSDQFTEKVIHFVETTPPARLSRNLRNLLLEHLSLQKDGYSFDLDDLLIDLLSLFELLESVEQETGQNKPS